MAKFTTTFGTTDPRDLFYPNVLTPTMELDPSKVQDSFRRAFDFIYEINPPKGSRKASSVLDTAGFIDQFSINLDNNFFLLAGEQWNSSTAGVSWNAHTLTYHGVAYNIAAGGPTTDKWIYWSLANAGKYQTAPAVDGGGNPNFPDLSFVNADGSVASGLVAVWNSSDGKLYPFWSAKLAPAFVSTALIQDAVITTAKIQNLAVSTAKIALASITTALIQDASITTAKIGDAQITTAKIGDLQVTNAKIADLTADKITTGTLAASVAITLTRSDSVPAKLIWQSTGSMYASVTSSILYVAPNADNANFLILGSDESTGRWAEVDIYTKDNGLKVFAHSSASVYTDFIVASNGVFMHTELLAGIASSPYTFTKTLFSPPKNATTDFGSSSDKWAAGYFSGNVTAAGIVGTTIPDTRLIYSGSGNFISSVNLTYSTDLTLAGGVIKLDSGKGIQDSGANSSFVVTSTVAQIYANGGAKVADLSTTNCILYISGALRTVLVDNADYGTGVKNHLYY